MGRVECLFLSGGAWSLEAHPAPNAPVGLGRGRPKRKDQHVMSKPFRGMRAITRWQRALGTAAAAVLLAASLGLSAPGLAQAAGGRVLPAPAFLHRLTAGPAIAPGAVVHATLVLQSRNPAGLGSLATAVSTPGNLAYHHFMSRQQILAQYGPNPTTAAALVASLRQQGFSAQTHGWTVSASAPASRWTALLSTRLATYQWHGHTFRGQEGSATVPAWMASTVSGVTGLTTFAPPAPVAVAKKTVPQAAAKNASLVRSSASPASVTASNGPFSVTATIPGGANKPTGMPVHVILQASYGGSPDLSAGLAPTGDPVPTTSTGTAPASHVSAVVDGGDLVLAFTSSQAMTASEQVAVYPFMGYNGYPISGYPPVTLTLPPLTWTGPSTVQALTAQGVNQVYGASGLTAQLHGRVPQVGVFAAGVPTAAMLAALDTFSQQNQMAPPTVTTVPVSTGAIPPGTGWGFETTMDLQDQAAAAPGAHITVYSDPAFDVGAMLQAVMNQPVSAVSFSFGTSGVDAELAPLADALTVQGVSLLVSSGDSGSQSGNFPQSFTPPVLPPAISEPADLSPVTAIGGTDVAVTQNLQPVYTQAWGGLYLASLTPLGQQQVLEAKAASGGGFSLVTPVPSWQAPFLPAGATGRGVPDLGIMADPYVAGLAIVGRSGTAYIGGGTSQGAPLMAGWVADMAAVSGTGLGSLDPLLYQLAAVDPTLYTQSVAGDNGAYAITSQDNTAGTWNPITGLGSPNITALAQVVMAGSHPSVFVTAPATAPLGSSVTLDASSMNLAHATYQFWVRDPQDGAWTSSGAFSAASAFTFTPAVPGGYTVQVMARSASGGAIIPSATATVQVTTNRAMVSALTVESTAGRTVQPAGASVTFTANATDSGPHPEYQFWVRGPAGVWQIAQNYSGANAYTAANLPPGSYAVAVYALDAAQVAAGAWSQAFSYATVVNVASAVTLSAPATGTVGSPVSVTAKATGLTTPVFQFWVEAPDGTWTQSGAYSQVKTDTFTPSQSGTYHVMVYAKDPVAPATSQFAVTSAAVVSVSG